MAADGEATIAAHMCPLCEAGCGLDIHLVNGEVSLIRGDRNDVFSHGFCARRAPLSRRSRWTLTGLESRS